MKCYIVVILMASSLFSSCLKSSDKDKIAVIERLKSKNDSLQDILNNNLVINKNMLSEHLIPITVNPCNGYKLGDSVSIMGSIGIRKINSLNLRIEIDKDSDVNINQQELFWTTKYKPKHVGRDTIKGYYTYNIGNSKQKSYFEHYVTVNEN